MSTSTAYITSDPSPEHTTETRGSRSSRSAGITIAWWLHTALRIVLAFFLLGYGASKILFQQFGMVDLGDALTAQGEMSPMGMLWRMVAVSPLFQFLAGLAELGAGMAILWRRTAAFGALLGFADMVLVFVLNLGYDVPVKQLSGLLALGCLVALTPWLGRLVRALLGSGPIPSGRVPRLLPRGRGRLSRATDVIVPVLAIGLAALTILGARVAVPAPGHNEAAPVGVWTVQHDAHPAAAQLSQDTRIQKIAFGEHVRRTGKATVTVRHADGTLQTGTYTRPDAHTVRLELRPLRQEGQPLHAWQESKPTILTLKVAEDSGTLHLSGSGEDLQLVQKPGDRVLNDRGFSWTPQPDAPFNR